MTELWEGGRRGGEQGEGGDSGGAGGGRAGKERGGKTRPPPFRGDPPTHV